MTSALDSAITVAKRLSALARYDVFDTAPEADFDRLAQLARTVCQAPVATVGFVDGTREWFKCALGIELTEYPIEDSFSARAILGSEVLVVPDTFENPEFSHLPLVAGSYGIRFYAGAPLITREGTPIGTLSVMARSPRANVSLEQLAGLETIATQVMAQLDLRRTVQGLALALCQKHAAIAATNELRLLLPMCSNCKDVRTDDDYWRNVDEYLSAHQHLPHGLCPECQEESSSPVSLRPQPYSKLLGSRRRFAV